MRCRFCGQDITCAASGRWYAVEDGEFRCPENLVEGSRGPIDGPHGPRIETVADLEVWLDAP